MAMPEGMSSVSPGSSVRAKGRHALKSRPALPGVAYCESCSRRRRSRILTSIFVMLVGCRCELPTLARPMRASVEPGDVRDELMRNGFLRGARQRMSAVVVEQRDFIVVRTDRLMGEICSQQRKLF